MRISIPEPHARQAAVLWRALSLILVATLLAACSAPGGGTEPSPESPESDGSAPPEPEGDLRLAPVATSSFALPLGVVTDGVSSRLYVLEQGGAVRVVEENGSVREQPFLDLTELQDGDFIFANTQPGERDERGLLGMTFRPGSTDQVFVHYNDATGDTVVARMAVLESGSGLQADVNDQTRLLHVPQDDSNAHRGGQLTFGPDGMLYLGLGDGGTGGEPARDPSDPRGSILRMDVDRPEADYVPTDGNAPTADEAGRHPLVLHTGLRNPWRFSFDPDGDHLWIADVGQSQVEEVNRVDVGNTGHDFGWPAMEGDVCYADDPCDPSLYTAPALTYRHDDSRKSITGGYVYRGSAAPSLDGLYVFGDFVDGTIRAARPIDRGLTDAAVLLSPGRSISSLGVDADGELLVVDYVEGSLFRIVEE